jgi:hypothetical protein
MGIKFVFLFSFAFFWISIPWIVSQRNGSHHHYHHHYNRYPKFSTNNPSTTNTVEIIPNHIDAVQDHEKLYSSHHCIGDHGAAHMPFSGGNLAQGDINGRICRFTNVCLRKFEDSGDFYRENDPGQAMLMYFRDPRIPLTADEYAGWDGYTYSHFPADFGVIVSEPCEGPTCSRVSLKDIEGPIPKGTSIISHRTGLMKDWCTYSLGHLLIDFMLPLYANQMSFYLTPTYDFQMISIREREAVGSRGASLEPKFRSGYSKYNMQSAKELYEEGVENGHTNNSLICFREMVAGNWHSHPYSHKNTVMGIHFRNFMLTNWGLNPNYVPKKHLILMLQKDIEHSEGRAYRNTDEIITKMEQAFGKEIFRMESFKGLDAKGQAALAQKATVFIGPGSGGSFAAVFMANSTVRLELSVRQNGKEYTFGYESIFYGQLSYLHNWRYPVTEKEFYYDRPQNISHGWEFFRSDYTIDTNKLIYFTKLAMEHVEKTYPHLKR